MMAELVHDLFRLIADQSHNAEIRTVNLLLVVGGESESAGWDFDFHGSVSDAPGFGEIEAVDMQWKIFRFGGAAQQRQRWSLVIEHWRRACRGRGVIASASQRIHS